MRSRSTKEFKRSANPFIVYKDGRVQKLNKFVEKFGFVLLTHEKEKWANLVGETIRVLHKLTPIGVAMAGQDVFDPYKD